MVGVQEAMAPGRGGGTAADDLEALRGLVQRFLQQQQYQSALFWADKVASLSQEAVQDIYWLAQCLSLTGQHHRASHTIRSRKLDKTYPACRYLAAKCHFTSKEYQVALDVLEKEEPLSERMVQSPGLPDIETHISLGIPPHSIESSIALLRGCVLEAMENRVLAAESFRDALRLDAYCYEAFQLLTTHHMLTAREERELLESLSLDQLGSHHDTQLLRFLYQNKLKKYNKPRQAEIPGLLERLAGNLDVVMTMAERHYYNCDFPACYSLTSAIMCKDPYHAACLPVHIGVLVELFKTNELFYLSHKLVDLYPANPVSWFAVGCYYLVIGQKNEHARRYLSKSTSLDRMFGPAWIAFGHSFAVESEHDQAMAAYFTAAQLMRGCHLPLLYIGLEYGLTNNPRLAERFFTKALSIAPEDPFVLHEMGVVAFQNEQWKAAYKHFSNALSKIKAIGNEVTADKWEPLLNNLGHVCRKLQRYSEALDFHQQALLLIPQNSSTYSSLGYVLALTGDFKSAIDHFHKALGLRRDDTFSLNMLASCTELYVAEMEPYVGPELKQEVVGCYEGPMSMVKLLGDDHSLLEGDDTCVSGIRPLDPSSISSCSTRSLASARPPHSCSSRVVVVGGGGGGGGGLGGGGSHHHHLIAVGPPPHSASSASATQAAGVAPNRHTPIPLAAFCEGTSGLNDHADPSDLAEPEMDLDSTGGEA